VRLQLDPNSLKHRFAGINKCFRDIHNALDEQLTVATSAIEPVFDRSTESQIWANLDSLLSEENAFRCYARRRIDYYRAQKELSILSLSYVWGLLTNVPNTKEAQKHLEDPAKTCDEANPS
jgi:hypothetical protein